MFNRTIALAAAVALTGGWVAAVASPAEARTRPVLVTARDPEAPTRYVSYADLNLASLSGEKTLNRRVGMAVTDVCVESTLGGGVFAERQCRDYAWNGARPQIARAVDRAREIATTGRSSLAVVAITLSFPR